MSLFSFPENVTIHVHEHPNPETMRELKSISDLLTLIHQQNQKLMSVTDDIKSDVAVLGTGITALIAAINKVTTLPAGAISAEDAATIKADLDAEVKQVQDAVAGLTPPTPTEPAPTA